MAYVSAIARALILYAGLALHGQFTGATTSGQATTTDDTSLCPAEYGACLANSACFECASFIEAAYDGCRDPDYSGLTATCSEKAEAGCCQLEGSVDCVDNILLGAVYGGLTLFSFTPFQ